MLSRFSRFRLFATLWTVHQPGSSVHGILQKRILECVAMPSSRGFSRPGDQTQVSYISCIGRWLFYHWCHRESPWLPLVGSSSLTKVELWPPVLEAQSLSDWTTREVPKEKLLFFLRQQSWTWPWGTECLNRKWRDIYNWRAGCSDCT